MSSKEKQAEKQIESSSQNEAGWADGAADNIVDFVGQLREKITSPFKSAAKFFATIPFLILAFVGVITLLTIGVFRILDVYLPFEAWAAHFITGGIFMLVGIVLWLKRPNRAAT